MFRESRICRRSIQSEEELRSQLGGNQERDRANIRNAQIIAPTPAYTPQAVTPVGVNVYTGQKAPVNPKGQLTVSQGLGENQPSGVMAPAPGLQTQQDRDLYRGDNPEAIQPGFNEAQSAGFADQASYNANLAKSLPATKASDALKVPTTKVLVGKDSKGGSITEDVPDYVAYEQIKTERLKQDQVKQSAAQERTKGTQTADTPTEAPPTNPLSARLRAIGTPEMMAYADVWDAQIADSQRQLAEAGTQTSDLQSMLAKEKAATDLKMQKMDEFIKSSSQDVKDILKQSLDDTNDQLALQKNSADQRLVWDAQQMQRTLAKQEVKQRESMIARSALFGGFGQDAALREIDASDQAFEDKIREVQNQLGMDRTDLAVKFSGLYVENQQKYRDGIISEIKDTQSQLISLQTQNISNVQAYGKSEREILQNSWNRVSSIRKEASDRSYQYAKDLDSVMSRDREEKSDKEKDALARIDYLLKNYPRESVAEAIKELGKSVTSFDVQALIDNPTLDEITKAEAALAKKSSGSRSGGAVSSSFLPPELQEPVKPEISFDDYMKSQMDDMESTALQSFTPDKRAKLMEENMDKWQKTYDAMYLSGLRGESVSQAKNDLVAQFGQPVVDAAQLIMDGTYTGTDPIGKASKALNVPSGQVATALTKLRMSGAISDTAVLSAGQQKSWKGILDDLKQDTFYSVWNGSKSAVSRIEVAIGDSGGADGISDIMAINAFQNGIVDPGATVREGDVVLMQTAKAWSEVVNLEYQKERVTKGSKLPESMRKKMLQLATATRDAYERDFREQTIPRFQVLVKQNGLPNSVLDDYLGTGSLQTKTTVSSEVQSFADTYFSQ